ncbi:EKC/KEOPS complex subunit Tprkb-like [Zophobas morio]|uniref:EKC/KEOPS complex subunit Tprkb-like n=1 Tax=Zophobas morio TaxID=2755281 RepID=UPI0030834370
MTTVALDPTVELPLTVQLYRNVKNVPELRQKVIAGQIKCCFINPKYILDPFQLIVAANKALTCENRITKTVFTEILYNLSISKNITRSLQQFGITDDCRDLLVVMVGGESDGAAAQIDGEEADLGVLEEIRDLGAIRKAYKIKELEEKNTTLLDSVVSRIATKDFIVH